VDYPPALDPPGPQYTSSYEATTKEQDMKRFILSATAMILVLMAAVPAFAAGKKVLFIDSYHEGYAWSDGVLKGAKTGFEGSDVELQVIHMDTKRNPSDDFKQSAALKVKSVIEGFNPDVVIASDDNAAKFVIQQFYKDADLPFVFCGVNWDASVYGMPYSNTTGMVEVAPVMELLEQLKNYTPGSKVGYIATDVLTAHKEEDNYKTKFGLEMVSYYVSTMDEWKKNFISLQKQVDILMVGNTAGLAGWNEDDAAAFVAANTTVPSGAIEEHMAPFAMISFVKVPEEQGFYAANTALQILGGTSPKDISVVTNKEGKLYVNLKIARALGIEIPYDILGSASAVIE